MNWATYTLIILYAISFGIQLAKHGEQQGKYNAIAGFIGTTICMILLYFGGWFT